MIVFFHFWWEQHQLWWSSDTVGGGKEDEGVWPLTHTAPHLPHPSHPLPQHTHTHTLLHSKKKNEKQRKKERISKQKLLKHCHQGQNDIVSAILERLEFKNVSCRPTMVASNTFQYYMAPSLWNSFHRPFTLEYRHGYSFWKRLVIWISSGVFLHSPELP